MNSSGRVRVSPGLIVIGASTGGPRVLCDLMSWLPPVPACILIVQHFPKFINASFVQTLGRHTKANVSLAEPDEELTPGRILIAPSDMHCRVIGNSRINLAPGPRVNYVCPSIDVTMQSLSAPTPGTRLMGVLLTGMGRDGAAGLAHIKSLGGLTIAQNHATCAVYGMPAEAVKLGCVDFVLSPSEIAEVIGREFRNGVIRN